MSEEQLSLARELYEIHGLSMGEVAGAIETSYSSHDVATQSLYCAFRARGWPIRNRSEGKALANARRLVLSGGSL